MAIEGWLLWILPSARLAALLWTQVLWRTGVGLAWWPIAAVLAVTLAPRDLPPPETGIDGMTALVVELLLGATLGLLVTLPGYALLGATALAQRLEGIGSRAGTSLMFLAVALVAGSGLVVDLHHPLLATARDTFSWLPLARPDQWAPTLGGWPEVAQVIHGVTVLALALASPILLAAVVIEALALLVAGGPYPAALVAGTIRGWAQAVAALVALAASWAAYQDLWRQAWS